MTNEILGAAYCALELRNRWAHPASHDPMHPKDAVRGIVAMAQLVRRLGESSADLDVVLDALGARALHDVATAAVRDIPLDADVAVDAPGFEAGEVSAKMTQRVGIGPAYAAAALIRHEAFEAGGSIFGSEPVWTAGNLRDLQMRLLDQKEAGLATFVAGYQRVLADAGPSVVQLAAEALYVHLWVNALSIKGETKRKAIRDILALASSSPDPPDELMAALDMGLVRTSAGFHQWRWKYLSVIVQTALELRKMQPGDVDPLFADPWLFRAWLLGSRGGLLQRFALLHLMFPDVFEAIVSESDKERILKHLRGWVQRRNGNIDRDLFDLRRALAPDYGPRFDYYRRPVVDLWRDPFIRREE